MKLQKIPQNDVVCCSVRTLARKNATAFSWFIVALMLVFFPGIVIAEEWIAPSYKSRKENPVAATRASIEKGASIFQSQCVVCHGQKGKGDGPAGLALKPPPADLASTNALSQSDGALFWKLSTGRTPMPGFEALVSEEDRWNIINFIRSLAPATISSSSNTSEKKEDTK